MQASTALIHAWLAAVLHVQPVAELCMRLPSSGTPAQGGGALVVGTVEVPLPGVPTP